MVFVFQWQQDPPAQFTGPSIEYASSFSSPPDKFFAVQPEVAFLSLRTVACVTFVFQYGPYHIFVQNSFIQIRDHRQCELLWILLSPWRVLRQKIVSMSKSGTQMPGGHYQYGQDDKDGSDKPALRPHFPSHSDSHQRDKCCCYAGPLMSDKCTLIITTFSRN